MHIYIWSHIKIYLTGLVAAEAVPVHFLKISEHSLSRCNYDLYALNEMFVSFPSCHVTTLKLTVSYDKEKLWAIMVK